jgi:hypothetical protein
MTKQVQIVYSSSSSARLWQFQFFRETDRQRDLSSPENASTSNNSSTIASTSRRRRTSEYVLDLISFELFFLGRHYFKNCFIQGSIDFIFGDGQSLYQVNNQI